MTAWGALALGLIQGVAEFLPISSSGHLAVLQNLFGMQTAEQGHLFFDVLLHLGTLISVCIVYYRDLADIVAEVFSYFRDKRHPRPGADRPRPSLRLAVMLVIATLPLFLILPISDYIEKLYYNTFFIGLAFLLTGLILFVADRLPRGRTTEKNLSVRDALVVGVCQAIATIPGLSRSGTTITAGLATGFERNFAVKFSFLLSVPAVLGANILSLAKAVGEGIDKTLVPLYLLGMAAAMVSGCLSIWIIKRLMRSGRFGSFSYYLWAAGLVTIVLSFVY